MNSPTSGFCKNEACPSSAELLGYQNGDLAPLQSKDIGLHLAACEFCDAEVRFYSIYPQAAEENPAESAFAEIPAPLYELAEALLSNRQSDGRSLNSLLKDKGCLVPDKV